MTESLIDASEAATVLGVQRDTIYALVRRGCPCRRLGMGPRSRLRFDRGEILAWADSCARGSRDGPMTAAERRLGDLLSVDHFKEC